MGKKDKKTKENDSGSLGYCSDPQFSPEHNINWTQSDHVSVTTWIEFTEQPADYRYRYLKEKYHGHIVGVSSPATKKKDLCRFPKLKLNNYSGPAIVRVWLISAELDKPRAHFHKLARKPPKGVLNLEPHDFRASQENNYEVTLDYLHIVHAVSNDENDINIYRKKKAHIESGLFDPPISLPASTKEEKEEIKQIDKNQSVFYIQVFDEQTHTTICQSIISSKIKNLHNAETGALKIVNCSRTFGTCRGNDEVFIFVEKISKDVQVRFFRLNNKKERIWQALAIYGPQHVHHQLGIVFRTPKFEQNIEKDTQVFFELHRTNDGACSEPYHFTYKPHEDYKSNDVSKKRPHSPVMSSEDEYLPSVLSSYNPKRIKDESMSPDSTTLNQITAETVHLDSTVYSTYITNEVLQPVDAQVASLLNSLDSNGLDMNGVSGNYIENNESTWLNLSDVLLDENIPIFDIPGDIRFDSVSSTEGVPDEDRDKDLLCRAQADYYIKPVSTNEDSPGRFIGVTKSEVKSGRKSSHSAKVDLLSAICLKKPIKEFNKILENTVDINAVDYEGNTALHYAVRSSVQYVEPILERDDVDRKLKNLWGDDALLDATQNGNIDIVKLLLEKDFESNVQNSRTGETPLHLAVSNENCAMTELLLQHGADPLLGNHSDKSAYEYSVDCSTELRPIMHFLMQKSMFQKRKSACSNEASSSPENDLVSKLNELTKLVLSVDSLISGYRIHGSSYLMGLTLLEVIAELLGKQSGASKGKGGSMHLYGKNFYGGNSIVGAEVPLGAGIASKYQKTGGVCFTIYGDGAAMQGQIFETINMAKLWNLPCVFVCENNGQALSLANSTVATSGISKVEAADFYTLGNYIPGIQVDGTDVITVREAAKFAINHIVAEKGPIILELVTPSGDSFNDLSNFDENSKRKDPIMLFRKSVATAGLITEEEFKLIEENTKKKVEESVAKALRDVEPELKELTTEIYSLCLEDK